jgi:hypothetical protein
VEAVGAVVDGDPGASDGDGEELTFLGFGWTRVELIESDLVGLAH